jgi:hypothetical protein
MGEIFGSAGVGNKKAHLRIMKVGFRGKVFGIRKIGGVF